ncbi:MAG: hypothetical protein FWF50_03990 [Defluviitaleaceae bacterium]|nr:hypothetical protein [Defluviitaleaceae bacterium]
MNQENIIHTLGKHEEQLTSLRTEITSLKNLTEQIYEMTATMKVLATKIDKQNTTIERFGKRIGTLETAPNSRLRNKFDYITKYALIAAITAIIAYLFGLLGL